MSRFDSNRAAEMEVFVRVVDLGGFTAAAQSFGLTPSGVSKLVSRLETRLGARLVNRSTRKLQLTTEGEAFYHRAVRILAEMQEAEREAAAGALPRGHLTVNSNIPFGMRYVVPLVPQFLAQNPDVTLDVVLTDTVIDLMEERADIAIRVGPLRTSQLIARKPATSRMVLVASPDYLARHGTSASPADLAAHRRIGWTFPRTIRGWPFRKGERIEEILPPDRARQRRRSRAAAGARRHGIGAACSVSRWTGYRGRAPCAGAAKFQPRRSRRRPCRLCGPGRPSTGPGAQLHRLPGASHPHWRSRTEARRKREVAAAEGPLSRNHAAAPLRWSSSAR
jgi:DNA-binding transcriptional LysR family regulator